MYYGSASTGYHICRTAGPSFIITRSSTATHQYQIGVARSNRHCILIIYKSTTTATAAGNVLCSTTTATHSSNVYTGNSVRNQPSVLSRCWIKLRRKISNCECQSAITQCNIFLKIAKSKSRWCSSYTNWITIGVCVSNCWASISSLT